MPPKCGIMVYVTCGWCNFLDERIGICQPLIDSCAHSWCVNKIEKLIWVGDNHTLTHYFNHVYILEIGGGIAL